MLEKIRYFLSPSFIEKTSILKALKIILHKEKKVFADKKILDIGCGSKPYAELFKALNSDYNGIDFKQHSLNKTFNKSIPDFYFSNEYKSNLEISEFRNGSFDSIVSFQVLEHHRKPEIFFSEANRLLRKGGHLLITFPFIWSLHEEPFDYQRLTHYKINDLAKENGFRVITIIKRGGVFACVSQILNTSCFGLKLNNLLKWILYLLVLLPFQYLAYFIEKICPQNKERTIFLGYAILLKKEKAK